MYFMYSKTILIINPHFSVISKGLRMLPPVSRLNFAIKIISEFLSDIQNQLSTKRYYQFLIDFFQNKICSKIINFQTKVLLTVCVCVGCLFVCVGGAKTFSVARCQNFFNGIYVYRNFIIACLRQILKYIFILFHTR